jgi:hypothetical protein
LYVGALSFRDFIVTSTKLKGIERSSSNHDLDEDGASQHLPSGDEMQTKRKRSKISSSNDGSNDDDNDSDEDSDSDNDSDGNYIDSSDRSDESSDSSSDSHDSDGDDA